MESKWNENLEGIVVISCNSQKPEDVICQIIHQESLPPSVDTDFNKKAYLWSLETKYYSANVYLYPLTEKEDLDPKLSNTVQAVIFCFDAEKQSSFEEVLSWMPYLKTVNAEVQLLICDKCLEECNEYPALEKKNILKWCVENEYELVEFNPSDESDDEEEEMFKDAKGYGRVTQALQAHTWANLVMKDEKCPKLEKKNSTDNAGDFILEPVVEEQNESATCAAEAKASKPMKPDSRKIKVEGDELDLEEKWLNNVLSGEDPGGESFEALFSRFASMKDKAEGLNGEDRKKYAEKVAIAFWRAMGGDEDEIGGLDDLED